MSTRANIVIEDDWGKLWFYRHGDGYPEGTMPTLQKFINWMRSGTIRSNGLQSAGWLILIGALEPVEDWKCGAYEPTKQRHSDIEFLYVIDCRKQTITCYKTYFDETKDTVLFVDTVDSPWTTKQPA